MNEMPGIASHGATPDGAFAYRAFVSYSHADQRTAAALHRWLEAYRVPGRLVGRDTCLGPAPERLGRFFRDRDEMPAAGRLSKALTEALRQSQFLVVVLSPATARSIWVNEEVRQWKAMGRTERLLAVIAPDAVGNPVEFMPEAMRFAVTRHGHITARPEEPVAADMRRDFDGAKLARLKLVAALTCLPLDALVQREAQRRQRLLGVVAVAASVLAVVLAWLAAQAIEGRREAERQRAEADGLIEFMLTDLRGRLDAVGRLDALDAVGKRALGYYANQKLDGLSAGELSKRAKALLLVGEVRNRRGDSEGALAAYREAKRTTGEQLARAPGDPERMFDHAQAVFWVGEMAWQRMDDATAEAMFREYDRLAAAMVASDPGEPRWQQEQSYAHAALGALLKRKGRNREAAALFEKGVAIDRALAAGAPPDSPAAYSLGQSHAWLADALRDSGDFAGAAANREAELAIYDRMLAADPQHAQAREGKAHALASLGRVKMLGGAGLRETAPLFDRARVLFAELVAADPDNLLTREIAAGALRSEVEARMAGGDWAGAARLNERLLAEARDLYGRDRANLARRDTYLIPSEAYAILIRFAEGKRGAARAGIADFEARYGALGGPAFPLALVAILDAADRRRMGDIEGSNAREAAARRLLEGSADRDARQLAAWLEGGRKARPAVPVARILAAAGAAS